MKTKLILRLSPPSNVFYDFVKHGFPVYANLPFDVNRRVIIGWKRDFLAWR